MTPRERFDEIQRLRALLAPMDVPVMRVRRITISDLRWMVRNLGINNGDHPDLPAALEIISGLLREWEATAHQFCST